MVNVQVRETPDGKTLTITGHNTAMKVTLIQNGPTCVLQIRHGILVDTVREDEQLILAHDLGELLAREDGYQLNFLGGM